MLKSISYLLFFLWISINAQAQTRCPELPKTYAWNTAEEYERDTELVKKTLRWLTLAPLHVELATRSEANLYVLRWLSGTPAFRIEINTQKLPFLETHPELMDSFMHGMALAYLTKGPGVSAVDAYSGGFQSVAQVALQSKSLCKCRHLRPLLKAAKKNEIKRYTRKVLEKADAEK